MTLVQGRPDTTHNSQTDQDWEAITPAHLVSPIKHTRKTFDESLWKCSEVTEKLCFAALHPADKDIDLEPYESAFTSYRVIIGPQAAQKFDRERRRGTPPAIFHAFLQVFAAGIRTEIDRVFKDVLQIGSAHAQSLKQEPAEWAKAHLSILITGNKHMVRMWIQSVCDKQGCAKPVSNDQDFEDFIHWRDWRAPKLIYMQPSGNLPYDPSTTWTREDQVVTERLLNGLSARVIQSLGFHLDKLTGTAQVEAAKVNRSVAKSIERIGNMGRDLSSAEHAVLTALGEAYPHKVHLHQLAAKIAPPLERGALLRAVEGLHSRSLIQCVPLRDNEGLADAANIHLTAEGAEWLKESGSNEEAPAKVTVLNVLIASPSDVTAERDAVESAIREWNTNHSIRTGIMLNPVRWETHSYPSIGDRPQGVLNKQIVKSAHFLIGIFGNRLGTPTGQALSGTIEEIEEIRQSGRHVALYFSNAPVPRNVDRAQLEALENYQRSMQHGGLCFTFASAEELRRLVTQHLPKIVDEVRANMKSGNAAGKIPRQGG